MSNLLARVCKQNPVTQYDQCRDTQYTTHYLFLDHQHVFSLLIWFNKIMLCNNNNNDDNLTPIAL